MPAVSELITRRKFLRQIVETTAAVAAGVTILGAQPAEATTPLDPPAVWHDYTPYSEFLRFVKDRRNLNSMPQEIIVTMDSDVDLTNKQEITFGSGDKLMMYRLVAKPAHTFVYIFAPDDGNDLQISLPQKTNIKLDRFMAPDGANLDPSSVPFIFRGTVPKSDPIQPLLPGGCPIPPKDYQPIPCPDSVVMASI